MCICICLFLYSLCTCISVFAFVYLFFVFVKALAITIQSPDRGERVKPGDCLVKTCLFVSTQQGPKGLRFNFSYFLPIVNIQQKMSPSLFSEMKLPVYWSNFLTAPASKYFYGAITADGTPSCKTQTKWGHRHFMISFLHKNISLLLMTASLIVIVLNWVCDFRCRTGHRYIYSYNYKCNYMYMCWTILYLFFLDFIFDKTLYFEQTDG